MIFLGLGVLFLVLGGVITALSAFTDGAGDFGDDAFLGLAITGGTFLLIGVIFTVVGAAMRRAGVRTERIPTTGVRGQATITAIGDSNMTVNERPVLDLSLMVTVPGRSPYPSKQRMVMPWSALGRIGVGMSVPVMVDPADPNSVVIEWSEHVVPAQASATQPMPAAQPNTLASMGAMPAMPNQLGGSAGMPGTMPGGVSGIPGLSAGPHSGDDMIQYLRGMGIDIPGPLASMITGAMAAQGQFLAAQGISIPGQVVGVGPGMVSAAPVGPVTPAAAPGAPAPPSVSAAVPSTNTPLDILADAAELKRTGRPGRASIRATTDLGVDIGGKRLLRLDLDVTPDGGPPYPLQHVAMVPESAIARISPGTSVAVHIDTTDSQNLEIDWDGA